MFGIVPWSQIYIKSKKPTGLKKKEYIGSTAQIKDK